LRGLNFILYRGLTGNGIPSRHFFTGVFLQEMPRIMDKVKYSGGRGQTKSPGAI
jgi:hypothetical protein